MIEPGYMIREGTKIKAIRRVIITGAENLAGLKRFLAGHEPKIMTGLRSLWKTQGVMITATDIQHMMTTARISNDLKHGWARMNREFVYEQIIPLWVRAFEQTAKDMAQRLRRLQKKEVAGDITKPAIQAWVDEHGGELITEMDDAQLKAINAMLQMFVIANPQSPYIISQVLRPDVGLTDRYALAVGNRLTSLLDAGMDAGQALAEAEKYAEWLQDSRSQMIARTELSDAYNDGQRSALSEAQGLGMTIEKTWETGLNPCDECADLDGETVGIDENFSSGDDGPTLHPGCECSLSYAVAEE